MTLTVKQVEDNAAAIAHLKQLLADPQKAQWAREILSAGHVSATASLGKSGSILRKACEAVNTYDFGNKFMTSELKDRMLQLGYRFKVKDPLLAVQATLRKMLEAKVVKIVEQGAGRRPNVYERGTK